MIDPDPPPGPSSSGDEDNPAPAEQPQDAAPQDDYERLAPIMDEVWGSEGFEPPRRPRDT